MAQKVTFNYMRGTDFEKYKSYKWVLIKANMHPDLMVEQQIKQAIDAQLVAKDFVKTEDEDADLYVGYQASVDQEREWSAYGTAPNVHWATIASATSSTIRVGTLGFDVYDRANKQIIWRGSATKALNPPQTPDKKRLEKAVAKLLDQFPPLPSMTRHGRH
jgi:hypothetical protein